MEIATQIPSQEGLKPVGHIQIYKVNRTSGETELVVDKPNMVMYQGADIAAALLAGKTDHAISHFYVGHRNDGGTPPSVNPDNSSPTSAYVAPRGYTRVALSFPPTFSSSNNSAYAGNIVVFGISLAAPIATGGAAIINSTSQFFEVCLVAATNDGDKVFSRAQFTPITYDSSYALTILWSVRFTAI